MVALLDILLYFLTTHLTLW